MNTVRAVIFDWAGTVVDYGSRAPVAAFTELFGRMGIRVDNADARAPMGMAKKDHIRKLLALPAVVEQWHKLKGSDPAIEDLDRLYDQFLPLQAEMVSRHADIIPGTIETVGALRERGCRIGSTTQYSRSMMKRLIPQAANHGYDPDDCVCADEVPQGRPAPWMALMAAMQLNCYPVFACIKVGDTIGDMAEGRNAGMWTVGVTRTGNELGLTKAETDALPPEELATRLEAAASRFRAAKANYVIEGIHQLAPLVEEISDRIAQGERP